MTTTVSCPEIRLRIPNGNRKFNETVTDGIFPVLLTEKCQKSFNRKHYKVDEHRLNFHSLYSPKFQDKPILPGCRERKPQIKRQTAHVACKPISLIHLKMTHSEFFLLSRGPGQLLT